MLIFVAVGLLRPLFTAQGLACVTRTHQPSHCCLQFQPDSEERSHGMEPIPETCLCIQKQLEVLLKVHSIGCQPLLILNPTETILYAEGCCLQERTLNYHKRQWSLTILFHDYWLSRSTCNICSICYVPVTNWMLQISPGRIWCNAESRWSRQMQQDKTKLQFHYDRSEPNATPQILQSFDSTNFEI